MLNQDIINGMQVIKKCLNTLSATPGVYKMMNKDEEILYIGKAQNLSKRIAQYTNINNLSYRLRRMISLVSRIDILFTKSEIDALILEADLIKSIKPKYNIALKDDKSFPYIVLDTNNRFPKINKFRGRKDNNQIYFGPFLSIDKLDKVIIELQKLFLVRNCTDYYFVTRKRPCLMYQIKRCSAPCVKKISQEEYSKTINKLKNFLTGQTKEIYTDFIKEMDGFSAKFMYEEAASLRDKIKLLNCIQSKNIFHGLLNRNIDIFVYNEEISLQKYCIQVHTIRGGHNFGDKCHYFDRDGIESVKEIICRFMIHFYQKNKLPSEVWCNIRDIDCNFIKEIIGHRETQRFKIIFPRSKDDQKKIQFVIDNTKLTFEKYMQSYLSKTNIFKDLVEKFHLPFMPEKIEVYDNSHYHGSNAVGCVIVVSQNGFIKNEYRKYKITNKNCMDDYFILKEVIKRRFKKINQHSLPDLIVIDGGKGHLSSVIDEFKNMNIYQVNIVAMSKGLNRNSGREFFYQNGKKSLQINKPDKTLLFLQNIRDEAHRFTISTHRNLIRKESKKSGLDSIEGIGEKRKKNLLLHFDSLKEIKYASEEDFAKIKGINKNLAKKIFRYIHKLNA